MEGRFGTDFAAVRVHFGADASRAARRQRADAFTFADQVVFGAGRYAPQTTAGQRLLVHELAHVVQQRAGAEAPHAPALHGPAVLEREAERAAGSTGAVTITGVASPEIMCAPRSRGQDEDDSDGDERHADRRADRRRSLQREQDRARAGKSETELLGAEDERKLRSLEHQYEKPGATGRSNKRKQRDLRSYGQAAFGPGTRLPVLVPVEPKKQAGKGSQASASGGAGPAAAPQRTNLRYASPRGAQVGASGKVGRFNELMNTPPGVPAQRRYHAGLPEVGDLDFSEEHHTRVDTEPPSGAAVNLKGNLFRGRNIELEPSSLDEYKTGGVQGIARAWLNQAVRNRAELDDRKPIELRSTLRPPPDLEKAMLETAFYPGSPVAAITFGTTKHALADYLAKKANEPEAGTSASSPAATVAKPRKAPRKRPTTTPKASGKTPTKTTKASGKPPTKTTKASGKTPTIAAGKTPPKQATPKATAPEKPAVTAEGKAAINESAATVAVKPATRRTRRPARAKPTPTPIHAAAPPVIATSSPHLPPGATRPLATRHPAPPPMQEQPPASTAAGEPRAPGSPARPSVPRTRTPPQPKSKPPTGATPHSQGSTEPGGHEQHGPTAAAHSARGAAAAHSARGATAAHSAGGGGLRLDNQGASFGAERTVGANVTVRGVTIGPQVGAGGNWGVSVVAAPGEPDKVLITTMIDLTGSGSVSAGARGVSISAGISVEHRAAFGNTLSGAAAKPYLDAMRNNGTGGTFPEHQLLRLGIGGNWKAATELYAQLRGGNVRKGQSIETTTATTAHAGAGAEGGAGTVSAHANYGRSRTDEVTVRIANQDDANYDVAVTVNRIDAETAGGGLDVAKVGGSVGFEKHVSTGQTYHFAVPIGDQDAKQAIENARAVADLARLARTYGAYFRGLSRLTGSGKRSSVDVSVLGAKFEMGGAGEMQQSVDSDAEGHKTGSSITASNITSGSVGAGRYHVGDSTKEEFSASVDEHGAADNKQLALGKSGYESSSSISIPGLTKNATTTKPSLYYANAAFDRVVGEAHDEHDWWQHVNPGTHLADDWRALQNRLKSTSHWVEAEGGGHYEYDATEVQAAIGAFTAGDTSGRLRNIDNIIHGTTGGADLGTEAAFPAAVAGYEADFKQYVVVDPVGNSKTVREVDNAVKERAQTGQDDDRSGLIELAQRAIEELSIVEQHLDALHAGLKDHEPDFTQAAVFAQMMERISQRRRSVRNEIAAMRDVIEPHTKISPPDAVTGDQAKPAPAAGAADVKPDPEAEQKKTHAEETAKENVEHMWEKNAALWQLLGEAETLINKGDFRENVDAINTDLRRAKELLDDWRAKRKANREAIQTYGINATFDGPNPDEVLGPRYERAWNAVHSSSLEQPHL